MLAVGDVVRIVPRAPVATGIVAQWYGLLGVVVGPDHTVTTCWAVRCFVYPEGWGDADAFWDDVHLEKVDDTDV